jgi:putative nucleotidyltransferase with HDIG domain
MSLFDAFKRKFRFGRKQRLEQKGAPVGPPLFSRLLPVLVILAVWGVSALNVAYQPVRPSHSLVKGQRSPVSIYAETSFEYPDMYATQKKREQVVNQVLDVYRIDTASSDVTREHLGDLFAFIDSIDGAELPEDDPLYETLGRLEESEFDHLKVLLDSEDKQEFLQKTINTILVGGVISPIDKRDQPNKTVKILDEVGRSRHVEFATLKTPHSAAVEVLKRMRERFPQAVSEQQAIQSVGESVLPRMIMENLKYDAPLTRQEREEASLGVAVVKKLVKKGAVFLKKDETVSELDLAKLEAHDTALVSESDGAIYTMNLVALLLLGLLALAVGCVYFAHQYSRRVLTNRHIVLIGVSMMLTIALTRGVEELLLFSFNLSQIYIYPALPIAMAAVLLTVLLNVRIGMSTGMVTSLLIGIQADDPMHVFLLGFTASCLGAFAVRSARTRTQTLRGCVGIFIAITLVESIYLASTLTPLPTFLTIIGIAAVNGVLTLMIVNLLMPAGEMIFGITTDVNLLELSDLNHPVLKRLQMEAPGTYHHTMMVATLAEHAAEAVGANTLLTRVASYFHDIGKLSNPTYFTENSFGEDRHSELSPRMSALIIINHVKEGMAMAKKYKLKQPIREVIESHHGTQLVYFFYHRAVQEKGGDYDAVPEEDYRYPGPLPRGREATIISLADACEAASRSLAKPTPQKINALVSEIFQKKLLDGQLAESELTMTEITIVEESVKSTLRTMLHGRISYPKDVRHDPPEPGGRFGGHPQQKNPKTPAPKKGPVDSDDKDGGDPEQSGKPDAA